jgi:hypothetical protein
MRLRLLLRRLTVSAPRMAVRSALPWPLRWAALAIVAGFCAAIGLWAFEFGKDIAGLDRGSKAQVQQLQLQLNTLRAQLDLVTEERDKAQSIANTVNTVLTTEKVAQEKLLAQNKQLEADKQRLTDDLGFFERLIPATAQGANAGTLAIRSLQAEKTGTGEFKWQVLVIQAARNPVEFKGQLEVTFSGTALGNPWTGGLPEGALPMQIKQYGRLGGVFRPPTQVEVQSISVKLLDGSTVKAMQSSKIQ